MVYVAPKNDFEVTDGVGASDINVMADDIIALKADVDGFVGIPAGVICMWSGSVASIPAGWALCNGANGTPNLQNKFIVGAGDAYNPADTGGEAAHVLSVAEMPAHNHGAVGNHSHSVPYQLGTVATGTAQIFHLQGGGISTGSAGGHTHTTQGSGTAHENRPPYYALAYIMKL